MPRAMWRGAIQFGLVTVPVKLYLATESRGGLSFNLLHKTCLNRIQMKTHCPEHGEIPRSDTVRGFEYSKGQYIVIDEGDFENVPLKTVRSIEIELFVEAEQRRTEPTFVKQAYYLEPEPIGRKAFYLLKSVLADEGLPAHLQDRAQGPRGAGRDQPVLQDDAPVDALLAGRGPRRRRARPPRGGLRLQAGREADGRAARRRR